MNALLFATDKFKKRRAKIIAGKLNTKILTSKNILNIGCGIGYLEKEIKEINPNIEILGIDETPQPTYKDEILIGDFEKLEIDRTFDIIILSLSLHHLSNPDIALRKAYELLNPNGLIFILEIAPKTKLLKSLLFDTKILCLNRRHSWTETTVRKIITTSGFKITKEERVPVQAVIFYAQK
jgi:2-polyprenyl-3-methyl-5-hydroxy-6-metoxy-1,4-benzoquinol methylase